MNEQAGSKLTSCSTNAKALDAYYMPFGCIDFAADVQSQRLLNMQINIEYNISYIYHSLYAFFDRDNIGLPGMRMLL